MNLAPFLLDPHNTVNSNKSRSSLTRLTIWTILKILSSPSAKYVLEPVQLDVGVKEDRLQKMRQKLSHLVLWRIINTYIVHVSVCSVVMMALTLTTRRHQLGC